MGGSLYLNNGNKPDRTNVCVSGYDSTKPNYALSNFERNYDPKTKTDKGYDFQDPDIGLVHFPTSEHYLHFQKIKPEKKKDYYKTWKDATAGNVLAGVNPKASSTEPCYLKNEDNKYMSNDGFNKQQWDEDKKAVQMQINATKYQQSAAFKASIQQAIDLGEAFKDNGGAATIIEDTSTASKSEKIWGTGTDGSGTNILGNTQTVFANMIKPGGALPPLDLASYKTADMKAKYDLVDDQFKKGLQPNLIKVRQGAGTRDTSDLGPSLVQPITVNQGGLVLLSPASAPLTKPSNTSSLAGRAASSASAPLTKPSNTSRNSSYENWASTKRLVLDPASGRIIGHEWRKSRSDVWQAGGDLSKFQVLTDLYTKSLARPAAPSVPTNSAVDMRAMPSSTSGTNVADMKTFESNPSLYKDSKAQAKAIWDSQVQPSLVAGKNVGLIYSANNEQAVKLHQANAQNTSPDNVIGGSGQALIFAELAKLIDKNNARGKVHLLPIATSMRGNDNTTPGNKVGLAEISRDLQAIASHKAQGWEIRGLGDASGRYLIGGGVSRGWNDVNNASIKMPNGSSVSQGAYVESSLQSIAKNAFQPLLQPQSRTSSPMRARNPVSSNSLFQPEPISTPPSIDNIKTMLEKGKSPTTSDGIFMLEIVMSSGQGEMKEKASDLLATSAIRNVMGNLILPVGVKMVDNNRAGMPTHGDHAMKVTFNSSKEAQDFADRLYDAYGVHSHTLGNQPKTVQNCSIFLTKDDLETITQASKIVSAGGMGKCAYEVKVDSFERSKQGKQIESNAEMDYTPRQSKQ